MKCRTVTRTEALWFEWVMLGVVLGGLVAGLAASARVEALSGDLAECRGSR